MTTFEAKEEERTAFEMMDDEACEAFWGEVERAKAHDINYENMDLVEWYVSTKLTEWNHPSLLNKPESKKLQKSLLSWHFEEEPFSKLLKYMHCDRRFTEENIPTCFGVCLLYSVSKSKDLDDFLGNENILPEYRKEVEQSFQSFRESGADYEDFYKDLQDRVFEWRLFRLLVGGGPSRIYGTGAYASWEKFTACLKTHLELEATSTLVPELLESLCEKGVVVKKKDDVAKTTTFLPKPGMEDVQKFGFREVSFTVQQ
jgi:hypothetical protein